MHKTVVVHNRYAWRSYRTKAAFGHKQGLRILTIKQLAARLAGGFLTPVDPDCLKNALADAIGVPLGELDAIKQLPGFQRAAAASLARSWSAGLTLGKEAEYATDQTAKEHLSSFAALEQEVLSRLPLNQLPPGALVAAASQRVQHARAIFGRIEIHGRTEMSPVWRPLLSEIAEHTEVVWVAEAREIPAWLSPDTNISVETSQCFEPAIRAVSCASPQHEILEAFRWARQHLATGIPPQELAIATASPEMWDDHVLAQAESSNLPVHFIHGRPALSTAGGQLCAALAEILLRGFSFMRVVRLVALLRNQNKRFEQVPGNWWRALLREAPLLDAPRWLSAISELTPESFSDGNDHRQMLEEVVETVNKGLDKAEEIGEGLLDGRALAVWRKALTEGPPTALDVTLSGLRVDDGVEIGGAMVWGSAAAIAAAPRPFTWLLGLSSRSWPRRTAEDPLLPHHIVAAERLTPLPVHDADRRDFQTLCNMAEREVVYSRARRDSEGRLNGVSPLYRQDLGETYFARSREAEHAASAADRLMARPREFQKTPRAVSAHQTWANWRQGHLTGHDGLVRADHPLLLQALNRQQSARSLVKLLRDPLGYLWTYGFGWREPTESDEPLTLDPLDFGNLLHEVLEDAVTRLEDTGSGGVAGASHEAIAGAVAQASESAKDRWDATRPVPPPVVWERKLAEAKELALTALALDEAPLPDQRSWAEIPFGGDPRAECLSEEACETLPWDPNEIVPIPGTSIRIGGSIDRLDLAGDKSRARVTDYKSGKLRNPKAQIRGGQELQRCLYAFAVKALIDVSPEVEARLFYPRSPDKALALDDPEGTLERLKQYLVAASESFAKGMTLPGPDAEGDWYDLAFPLPGGAKEVYLNTKRPFVAEALAAIAPLWEEP